MFYRVLWDFVRVIFSQFIYASFTVFVLFLSILGPKKCNAKRFRYQLIT